MKRCWYQLRLVGMDALWIPLAVTAGFIVLVSTGGELIRDPSTLTLWSEMILPALTAILSGLAASPVQDRLRSLIATGYRPAWVTYLERAGLLLGFVVLLSILAGWIITAVALPHENAGLAPLVSLLSLPVLLVFTILPLLIAEWTRSGPGGAAAALALWLFFVLVRKLAFKLPWTWFYPFLTYYNASSPIWIWNRAALTLVAIGLIVLYVLRLRRNAAGID